MSSLFKEALRAHQAGQTTAAEFFYRQAIAAGQEVRSARNNLVLLLVNRRAFAEAKALLAEAVAGPGADAASHFMLARLLAAEGDETAARASLERASSLDPTAIPVRLELARLLAAKGEFQAARERLDGAGPGRTPGEVAAILQGRAEIEMAWADRDPAGEALHLDAAEAALREALALAPRGATIVNNLAMLLRRRGALEEAETLARQLPALAPRAPESALTLAAVLAGRDPGREEEAVAVLRQALAQWPDDATLHYNLAYSLLRLGRLREAWPHYARRFERPRTTHRPMKGPRWDGAPTQAPLLVWAELGFGDVLQFARFLPQVAARAPNLILACQPALMPLFRHLPAVAQVVDVAKPLPPYGAQIALLDLGLALGIETVDLPGPIPFLTPPPDDGRWREIEAAPSPRIGIVWVGNRESGPARSTSLDRFARLAERLDLTLLSLQMGPAVAEIAKDGAGRVTDLSPLIRDFGDTASAIARLDLVITVDTAVGHLAGALDKETWLLLPHRTGWMWHFDPERSVWYPKHRLFRQPATADWDGLFAKLEPALAEWLGRHGGSR
ncbi:MAG TPA: tetratricopeptide repeat protein [Hypericibacter adhaerens]|uniref:tetratricopeptide repeat protein n=1 Tax=Hypericibacter adhaerens TaxID=2602016 RepID=UPI002C98AA88|nr:tetratricopeptide repeat protein [Hypericibacter adhaerens]HWA43625.1 tetratricopeptide repeat protein [Hypericibacter adhaerens]